MLKTTVDFIKESFELNKMEAKMILLFWKNNKSYTVKELVLKIGRDRTTIQKIAKNLLEKNLLTKKQINLNRGYCFKYSLYDESKIVSELETTYKKIIKNYTTSLNKILILKEKNDNRN